MVDGQTARESNRLCELNSTVSVNEFRYRWQCPVQEQTMGDFHIVPLTTANELASEGRNMHDCVASYGAACAKGLYQVFSIRDLDGERVATLGLVYAVGGWKVDQCIGILNDEVTTTIVEWIDGNGKHDSMDEPTDLHFLAQDVARLMNNTEWKIHGL
jgi:hypothetical protein